MERQHLYRTHCSKNPDEILQLLLFEIAKAKMDDLISLIGWDPAEKRNGKGLGSERKRKPETKAKRKNGRNWLWNVRKGIVLLPSDAVTMHRDPQSNNPPPNPPAGSPPGGADPSSNSPSNNVPGNNPPSGNRPPGPPGPPSDPPPDPPPSSQPPPFYGSYQRGWDNIPSMLSFLKTAYDVARNDTERRLLAELKDILEKGAARLDSLESARPFVLCMERLIFFLEHTLSITGKHLEVFLLMMKRLRIRPGFDYGDQVIVDCQCWSDFRRLQRAQSHIL